MDDNVDVDMVGGNGRHGDDDKSFVVLGTLTTPGEEIFLLGPSERILLEENLACLCANAPHFLC